MLLLYHTYAKKSTLQRCSKRKTAAIYATVILIFRFGFEQVGFSLRTP